MNTLSNRIVANFAALDLLFGVPVGFALTKLLAVQQTGDAYLVFAGFLGLKIAATAWYFRVQLRPFEDLAQLKEGAQLTALPTVDARLRRLPVQGAVYYSLTWIMAISGFYLITRFGASAHFAIPEHADLAVALALGAVSLGAFALIYPILALFLAPPSGQLWLQARAAGIQLPRPPQRLATRLGFEGLSLSVAPLLWVTAVGYMAQAEAGQLLLTHADAASGALLAERVMSNFLVSTGAFAVVILFWAPMTALFLSRAVSAPVEALSSAVGEVVSKGNQSSVSAVAVINADEVGYLGEQFNDLLDMMRDLSKAANEIAGGKLNVAIPREGELPDAFRKMAESLSELVTQIRSSSLELGATATQILAATQEQESATASQSTAMTEISHTMDSLSGAAAHVSESAQGVLSNAQQTVTTTDTTMLRIESLSQHTGRINELLETIRGIADRSDLLALNGSLEASRAGESGQGFALVAGEMRRLAVRVGASVEDVKNIITDIRSSSTDTVVATEESRRLARETSDAASQISLISQQQRSGTEQVSASVREAADVITQAAAATTQTRCSAQGLKDQADALSTLVRRFELQES